ncbi:NTF2-like domain [Cinara cedri]|uniref:NTF2-like domain n=1 Tax=Cinara cedri TaxID=506608 RepID=A0A5E4MSL1_9HEMI|nr:NTF2-like domain [Cinara cedri]
MFYEEHGDYRTIYEDGTSVLAKNWEEINNVILSPSTFSDIFVRSITTEPCGGSLHELLITVIGIRFKHVLFVDYRPSRELNYAIVKSVKQYFPADHPTQENTFAAGDNIAKNTDNNEPAGKKQGNISDDIAKYKNGSKSTELGTTSKLSCDTVNNDVKHEIKANNTSIGVKTSATEVSFKFAQRYYATLESEKELAYLFYEEYGEYRTIYEDGTSVLATNWEEINSVILRHGTFSDIFVKSITSDPYGGSLDELLITVIGIRFKHVFIARYRPNRELHYAIVKSVNQYFPAN